jgi:N-formylglutamate deformylase
VSAHFQVVEAGDPAPIVVEIPHAGIIIDDEAAQDTIVPPKALAKGALALDSDLGADLVWEGIETVGVTRIVARASRYVIDLNSDPHPPPVPPFYEENRQSRSFTRRSQCGMSWTQKALPDDEVARRLREVFEPYHAAIDAELARAKERHTRVLLLCSHTFPDPQGVIADVVLGTGEGRYATSEMVAAIAVVFRAAGLSVALERPFPGGWSVKRHARPDEGIYAVQIELARRLVKSADAPWSCSPEAVDRLRTVMRNVAVTARTALLSPP